MIELYDAFKIKFDERIEEYRTMFQANVAKERLVKKTIDIFYKSEEN